jgi:hypothetical protein
MTKPLIASIVAALALVAAGCGGSDQSSSASPTDEWATGFCTAVTTWTDSLQSVTSQFTDLSSFSQNGIEQAAGDVKSATDLLVSDLQDLGAPDTESGQAVKDSIDQFASTLDTEVATIDDTAQGVSGLTDIPAAATSIKASLDTMHTAFSSTLQTIDSADAKQELQTAMEDSPACANISG